MTRQTHLCHWPACRETVPPRLWGCRVHWFALPAAIRRNILATYRTGQEIDKRPSSQYIAAAKAAQDWIKSRTPVAPTREPVKAFHEPKGEA